MATGFINITKHAVAESTLIKATHCGHIWSVQAAANLDNGAIVKRGAYVAPEYYAEAAASAFEGKIIDQAANGNWLIEVTAIGELEGLVLTTPLIYENFTREMSAESNFFNAKDDLMRVYELCVGDVFAVSAEGISGNIAKGAAVKVTNKKITVK